MKKSTYLITALSLLAVGTAVAAEKAYGPGNQSSGNWTANNWYVSGVLSTQPGLADRANITYGDRVLLDTSTSVDQVLLNTGGTSQVTSLTFDNASRVLTATQTVSMQTVYAGAAVISLSGGTLNAGVFRYVIGAGGSYPPNGNVTLSTGAGLLNVAGNFIASAAWGTVVPTSVKVYTEIGGGGEIRVRGNLDVSALNYAAITSTFSIGATATTFGKVTVTGTANFVGTDLIIDVSAFTGSGTQTLVSAAGGWTKGFDTYAIKTSTGTTTVTLGQTITEGAYSYTLNMSGNNLNLVSAIPEPAVTALALGGIALLLVSRSRFVRRR